MVSAYPRSSGPTKGVPPCGPCRCRRRPPPRPSGSSTASNDWSTQEHSPEFRPTRWPRMPPASQPATADPPPAPREARDLQVHLPPVPPDRPPAAGVALPRDAGGLSFAEGTCRPPVSSLPTPGASDGFHQSQTALAPHPRHRDRRERERVPRHRPRVRGARGTRASANAEKSTVQTHTIAATSSSEDDDESTYTLSDATSSAASSNSASSNTSSSNTATAADTTTKGS